MINRPLIILKSGVAFIGSMTLLIILLLSMAEEAADLVEHTIGRGEQRTTQFVHHHGLGYQSTRAQPAIAAPAQAQSATGLPSLSAAIPLTDHVTIRPLTDIYVDGPPQIVNITTTYATLLFTSSVPVICSVVYGPAIQDSGGEFGFIAQDSNMNGGAIVDHRPLLAGLLPETEYRYRVQGTDATGIMYAGEVGSFTTPAEPAQSAAEINVAALSDGAEILAVSSNFGGADSDQTWGANSAIDGNPSTAWSSSGDGNDAFIVIGLTEPATIAAIDVWTRFMTNGTAQIFQFTVTLDPGSANSETFGPFTLPDATKGYRFGVEGSATAESIRLDVIDSSGGNTGLVEFKVFAMAAVTSTVTATTTNSLELFLPLTAQ